MTKTAPSSEIKDLRDVFSPKYHYMPIFSNVKITPRKAKSGKNNIVF
jgi:hypothetical protein